MAELIWKITNHIIPIHLPTLANIPFTIYLYKSYSFDIINNQQ